MKTFEEFDATLAQARTELDRMRAAEPDDGAIASVHRQLDTLFRLTRDGRTPTQGEKDQFNYGAIASRELDNYDVADSLFELASFVMYWGEPARS